jgi:hypothetical protein
MRWSIVEGFPNYKISDSGLIENMKGKILKPYMCNGYYRVHLYSNGKFKRFLVHRLVALHFLGEPEKDKEVNHIDGNKQNNKLENLEWITKSENQRHSYRTGLHNREKFKKLNFWDVFYIWLFKKERNYSNSKIAGFFNVSESTVSKIINNKTHNDYFRRVWNEQ